MPRTIQELVESETKISGWIKILCIFESVGIILTFVIIGLQHIGAFILGCIATSIYACSCCSHPTDLLQKKKSTMTAVAVLLCLAILYDAIFLGIFAAIAFRYGYFLTGWIIDMLWNILLRLPTVIVLIRFLMDLGDQQQLEAEPTNLAHPVTQNNNTNNGLGYNNQPVVAQPVVAQPVVAQPVTVVGQPITYAQGDLEQQQPQPQQQQQQQQQQEQQQQQQQQQVDFMSSGVPL